MLIISFIFSGCYTPEETIQLKQLINDKSILQRIKNESKPVIIISKQRDELFVFDKTNCKAVYPCSFGFGEILGSKAKVKMGNRSTPEGDYVIIDKHISKEFRYFLGINYPNIQDAERGLKTGIINRQQYQSLLNENKKIPNRVNSIDLHTFYFSTPLGGAIGIHGEKTIWGGITMGSFFDWTNGCIALDDENMEVLYQMVGLGTRVLIF